MYARHIISFILQYVRKHLMAPLFVGDYAAGIIGYGIYVGSCSPASSAHA